MATAWSSYQSARWSGAQANDHSGASAAGSNRPARRPKRATRPLRTPNALSSSFAMPRYRLAAKAEAATRLAQAESTAAEAREANQRSDNYALAVVLLAASLFFAGISTKLTLPHQRPAVLSLRRPLLGTAVWPATFPVTVSV